MLHTLQLLHPELFSFFKSLGWLQGQILEENVLSRVRTVQVTNAQRVSQRGRPTRGWTQSLLLLLELCLAEDHRDQ